MIPDTDIVVIGAGAAGLTVAYTLEAMGLRPLADFVVLDAEPTPGGTWRRGWDFARIGLSKEVVGLPGMAELGLVYAELDPETPTREAVPMFHRRYEDAYDLFVVRPARVTRVEGIRRRAELRVSYRLGGGADGRGPGAERELTTRLIVNATGHWSSPFIPWTPGARDFRGEQRHVAELESLDAVRGRQALVVGGGRSALAVLEELEHDPPAALWSTRRAPDFIETPRFFLGRSTGRSAPRPRADSAAHAARRAEHGAAFPSDASLTGIPLTRRIRSAVRSGYLVSRGPLARLTPAGARFADGSEADLDVVLWATGSRESVRHLAPLRLRERGGATAIRDGWAQRDRRVAFAGYGPGRSMRDALAEAATLAEGAIEALERGAR